MDRRRFGRHRADCGYHKERWTAVLDDSKWQRVAHPLPGKPGDPGRHDRRMFPEGVLRIARTGAPRRGLPAVFGH